MGGTLDREALRDEVKANLGNRTDSTPSTITTRVNRFLDLAQLRIARTRRWKEMETVDSDSITVTGTAATDKLYTHSITRLREVHSVIRRVGTNTPVKLRQIPGRQWDQIIALPDGYDAAGTDALFYMVWGLTQWELFPVPTRNYVLHRRYTQWPADFALDASVSALDHKDDMIISMATHIGFHSLGLLEDAKQWFAVYQDQLKRAIEDDSRQPDLVMLPRGVSEGDIANPTPWADPFIRRLE